MKKLFFLAFLLLEFHNGYSQRFGGDKNTMPDEDGPKLLYNYTYGSYYTDKISSPGNFLFAFNSVTYISNGRQQFGIGTGITIHNAKSDSGGMQFASVPLFLSNKFFLVPDENHGGLYIDFVAGFNLPVSATYTSGESSGNPIASEKTRSTGFFGLSIGERFVSKKQHNVAFIAELGYRNEHTPYAPPGSHFNSGLFGLSAGLSF